MPKLPLNAAQRRAHMGTTLDRTQATRLNKTEDLPFVHAGHERYLTLDQAVRHLGVYDTLTLAEDKRSVLVWYRYSEACVAALTAANFSMDAMLTPAERNAFAPHIASFHFHKAELFEPVSPLARAMHALSGELDALIKAVARDGTASRRVRPHHLRALFDTLMVAQIALNHAAGDEEDEAMDEKATAMQLRTVIAGIIAQPAYAADEMLEVLRNRPRPA